MPCCQGAMVMLGHELQILHTMRGDPGCVRFVESFATETALYVILENFITGHTDLQSLLFRYAFSMRSGYLLKSST